LCAQLLPALAIRQRICLGKEVAHQLVVVADNLILCRTHNTEQQAAQAQHTHRQHL
jgi:hypothetical protein